MPWNLTPKLRSCYRVARSDNRTGAGGSPGPEVNRSGIGRRFCHLTDSREHIMGVAVWVAKSNCDFVEVESRVVVDGDELIQADHSLSSRSQTSPKRSLGKSVMDGSP